MLNQPILYSFRRCPYAIRARLALALSEITVELREVALRNKPATMLEISPKGTVPVLQLTDLQVIDESLDIMLWALQQNDPENCLQQQLVSLQLIAQNDTTFKYYLDRYKYADRYPQFNQQYYREQAEQFLGVLQNRLTNTPFLLGENRTLADLAIFPFIRQFANVDLDWFENSSYKALVNWLHKLLESPLFDDVMEKYAVWENGDQTILFPR